MDSDDNDSVENDDNDTSETIGANNTEIGKDSKCILN